MNRRHMLILICAGALAAASPALAQTLEERIIGQLRSQGFDRISVSRTLLGRTRILALASGQRREIIFNPRTGEILRDFWESTSGEVVDIIDTDDGRGRGRGRGRGGDDDDDGGDNSGSGGGDDDGDGDDDDNSGSGGGGNSGSGGGDDD